MKPKYKLLSSSRMSYRYMPWVEGRTNRVFVEGAKLCTNQVLHYYDSPEAAVVFNPIHSYLENPICVEVFGQSVVFDGTKGGAKELKCGKDVPLPIISNNALIRFAIYVARITCDNVEWRDWANDWLHGKNRNSYPPVLELPYHHNIAARHAVDATWCGNHDFTLKTQVAFCADSCKHLNINFTSLIRQAIKDEAEYEASIK